MLEYPFSFSSKVGWCILIIVLALATPLVLVPEILLRLTTDQDPVERSQMLSILNGKVLITK